jgi:hypothetical protein
MSKGSKRRREDTKRINDNWDKIKWNESKDAQDGKKKR